MAQKEYPNIKGLAQKEGADIYFGDAGHIRFRPRRAHMWKMRRNANRPSHWRPPRHEPYFGDHVAWPHAVHDQGKRWLNAAVFIEFLKRLVAGAKRTIFLNVDRGPARRAKKTAAFVETLGGKLRLFFLPPYSPDRNPDELVWKHLKADTVGCMAVTCKDDFQRKVRSSRDYQESCVRAIVKKALRHAAKTWKMQRVNGWPRKPSSPSSSKTRTSQDDGQTGPAHKIADTPFVHAPTAKRSQKNPLLLSETLSKSLSEKFVKSDKAF